MPIRNNIKIVIRQIRQSGFLSFIKFLSLLLGFLICLVIMAWVKKELSFDDFWQNKDRIYRVALEQYHNQELQFKMAQNYRGVTDLMLAELPEIEGRVRLHRDKVTVFTPDAQVQDVNMFYTDTCIFDILQRKIIDSESSRLFPDLKSVVISESLSKQIFGNENPIGKQLKLNEGWEFRVSAVFEDVPENSHIGFDLLLTIPSLRYYLSKFNNVTGKLDEDIPFEYFEPGPYNSRSWGKFYGYSYILVKEGSNIEEIQLKTKSLITQEKIPSWSDYTKINLIFQPITNIHLRSDLSEEYKVNGSIFKVYTLLLVALIVLIISIVNFVNLSVIDFYDQHKNFAIRIYHGANIMDLLKLGFIKEFIISLSAAIFSSFVGYFIIKIFLPGSVFGYYSIVLLTVILIIISFINLNILYWILISSNLGNMLNKIIVKGFNGKITRKVFVMIQFTISIFLIASIIVVFSQLNYIQKKDTGFITDSIIFSYSPMTMNQRPDIEDKLSAFRDRMLNIPGVQYFCTSSSIPGKDFLFQSENVSLAMNEPNEQSYYQILNVDNAYLDTYDINLVAGRDFIDDEIYTGNEVLLNELAAKKLGFSDPIEAISKWIKVEDKNYLICGVVRDFHHLSLKKELTPVIIFKSLKWRYAVGYYSFKISKENLQLAIPMIEKAWSEIYPGEIFLFKFLDVNYQEQYVEEQNFGKALSIGAIMAILISCLGLLGFIRYSAVKRIKEIGIRKTFGASRFDILLLFNAEILGLLGIAAVLGLPLSWILVNKWLMSFAYRIEVSFWMFLSAFILSALVALGATFYTSWISSGRKPCDSLKYE